MASPIIVTIPANTWTIVATNVTSCRIFPLRIPAGNYLHTYRATGAAAPADLRDAVMIAAGDSVDYSAAVAAPIDVYVYADGFIGSIRLDA